MGLLGKIFRKPPKRNKDDGNAVERYGKSFHHAVDGFIYCFRYEHNMIIIVIATILVVACGIFFQITLPEWLFVMSMCGGIAACEALNSSIEAVVDLCTTEKHPLAKISKDTASTASLLLCITALIGGIMIFLPKVIEMFG